MSRLRRRGTVNSNGLKQAISSVANSQQRKRERGKEIEKSDWRKDTHRIGKRPSEKESTDEEILWCARIRVEEQEAEIAA